MADIVNLQQNEYDTVIEKLKVLHENAITEISRLSGEVRNLSQLKGGFYIEQISAKIDALLETLDTGIMTLVAENMELSEESMSDFAETILNVDTACNV